MPMFEDHLDDAPPPPPTDKVPPGPAPDTAAPARPIRIPSATSVTILNRKLSEESIRTELCEGPLPDSPSPRPRTPSPESWDTSQPCSDRAELIERLKRGESPTWVPNRHLEALVHAATAPLSPSRTISPKLPSPDASTLLPPADITPEKQRSRGDEAGSEGRETDERLRDGLNIERPRSALHSGDFTQSESSSSQGDGFEEDRRDNIKDRPLYSNSNAWLATSPPRHAFDHFTSFSGSGRPSAAYLGAAEDRLSGSSLSSSLSSSFVYKPPTSPLVQSETNDELDLTHPMRGIDITANGPRQPRRHTLTLQHSPSAPAVPHAASLRHPIPTGHRRDGTYPYQAHQPRKSLTSIVPNNFSLASSSPQTPAFLRSRRPSISSDASSPLHHASMVGSYEESILRGRMSTTPSRPLDFLAQIAVLGLGNKCKASLRCPAHVTLPFPAVFYSYSATTSHGRTKEDEGPSPYVGQIDLENGLPNSEEESRAKRKQQRRNHSSRPAPRAAEDEGDIDMDRPIDTSKMLPGSRRSGRQKRSSHTPKAPPGGSYRIPEKGQLQIIIKNQNKTAVKLFLIPYDLAGMEPGTKTFIRQRSYSAAPIIDNAAPSSTQAQPNETTTADNDRPILRYLIHLHICCPSPGRFYLYRSIRVVFANRVPDGKEKLRNELTFPEPRYTAYKPVRAMHPAPLGGFGLHSGTASTTAGSGAMLAAEKAYRRRSSGFSFVGAAPPHPATPGGLMDSLLSSPQMPVSVPLARQPTYRQHTPSSSLRLSGWSYGAQRINGTAGGSYDNAIGSSNNRPVDPIPFPLTTRRRLESVTSDGAASDETNTTGTTAVLKHATAPGSSSPGSRTSSLVGQGEQYNKLSRGDVGYGGNMFAGAGVGGNGADGRPGSAEGLLSRRLRGLDVQRGKDVEGEGR